MLRWPESAVDPARLHPLAQRLVDVGLLPLIEGESPADRLTLMRSAGFAISAQLFVAAD